MVAPMLMVKAKLFELIHNVKRTWEQVNTGGGVSVYFLENWKSCVETIQ